MDDFYLIHEDKEYLQYCRGEIEQYVARLGLRMNKKTNIFPLRNGIDFLEPPHLLDRIGQNHSQSPAVKQM